MPAPTLWFLPSFYGDIRLERKDKTSTVMIVEQVTEFEKQALAKFGKQATKKKWAPSSDLARDGRTTLKAPIEWVAKALAKYMKPGRQLVSVVKFSDGKMAETKTADLPPSTSSATIKGGPYREPATASADVKVESEKAVTVAAPVQGCPMPDFGRADVKAREVLEHFLTPEQMEDFRRHNRFVAIGGTTGHRYMVTSRHATDSLAQYQRQLYDLDENQPFCVHDWVVPAAEEMLAIGLMVQLPGWESHLRYLDT
jgi:hypothetical protein